MRFRVTCHYLYMLPDFTPGLEQWLKTEAAAKAEAAAKGEPYIPLLGRPTEVVPAHPESGGGQAREIEADSVQAAMEQMAASMVAEHKAISVTFEHVAFLDDTRKFITAPQALSAHVDGVPLHHTVKVS